jgi:hypothetical protein
MILLWRHSWRWREKHGGRGGSGKAVCRAVERRGARSARSADRQGQEPGAAAVEGADPAQGGCLGRRRGLERQPDRRGARDQRVHGLPGAQAAGGGGARRGAEPQAARAAGRRADLRRREGSQTDRSGLLEPAQGLCALEPAAAGEQGGRAWHCRARQRHHDRPGAKKTRSSRIAASAGSFLRRPTARS